MEKPTGTVVFTANDRPFYGFDIFSVNLGSTPEFFAELTEQRLTDGVSINYNGQFAGVDGNDLVYVSERTGSPQIYFKRSGDASPRKQYSSPESLFHDRPVVKNGRVFFISAHEASEKPFQSWSALYSTALDEEDEKSSTGVIRLTPAGFTDYSPSICRSGKFIAVASYGSRRWGGEFHYLRTDVVVFPESDPSKRVLVCSNGGWPTWCGDSVLYFHRQVDDGWWSIFRIDLPDDFLYVGVQVPAPVRVTPPGVHCFTPAAMHDCAGKVVVATRRKSCNYRHIEIFDLRSSLFFPVTLPLNPDSHHYNPFVSPESTIVAYHRFRGEDDDSTIPHLEIVTSPIPDLQMLRLNGTFPSFSPSGDLIAFNHDFEQNSGLKIVKSDGTRRWTLIENRTSFYNSWSPADNDVIFTSIGAIFSSERSPVQIARVTFDPRDLTRKDGGVIPVNIKILTREETGNNAFPSCSPDGKLIVFRSGRSGHKNLYIVDAVNGEFDGGIRQVTEGPWTDTMPCWSPDGKLIAFSSNRNQGPEAFGLYVMKPDGTEVRRIRVSEEEEERERLNHVCFSMDGKWLLFAGNLGGVTAEPVSLPNHFQPYGDVYIVKLDGSGLRRLTCNAYENGTSAWHPKLCFPAASNGGAAFDLSRLSLKDEGDEDKLTGQFLDPLWIKCDL